MEYLELLRNTLNNPDATPEGKLLATTFQLTAAKKLLREKTGWSMDETEIAICSEICFIDPDDLKVIEKRLP